MAETAARAHETVIGLEIHIQLDTQSKMFCGCPVEFGASPNTNVCPVCLGLPGALPVVNRQAIELAVRAALALNCQLHGSSVFARKNYFYPDLPKGYQISQYDRPLATDGWLDFRAEERSGLSRVRIRRLHIEEDSGKSLHDRFAAKTAVDLNRAGVPLVEIVTEPDLRSPVDARAFLGQLKHALEYLEVSDCNMEEGSLRVDANVSVRPAGDSEFMTKTEVKNMNSFSQLEKALAYEAARQLSILRSGYQVEHQTMLWDPALSETRPMRGKEEVHDYRYFPEPDLPTLVVPEETVERLAADLPEMPWQKEQRFVDDYGLPRYDAEVLSSSRALADLFEAVARSASDAKDASNWVMGEVLAAANDSGLPVERLGVDPKGLAEVIDLVAEGKLSHNLGRQVFRRMIETGKSAARVIEEEDLRLAGDAELEAWVREAIAGNPAEVERYRGGEEKLLAFFIGQVMQKSRGKADPARARQALLEHLGES
ncbi:MAG: Asp-tRNA(Asn)/Glu-tRNA(Gln) amidotransferase subunit GatB [Gemmatimonadales bacterium]|jgi:aspartyl-tRNA(Asn)/glutamyl-tRNA(Gln) amidotransferase subunit B